MKPIAGRIRNISEQATDAGVSVGRLVRCKTREQCTWRLGRFGRYAPLAAVAALCLTACTAPPPPPAYGNTGYVPTADIYSGYAQRREFVRRMNEQNGGWNGRYTPEPPTPDVQPGSPFSFIPRAEAGEPPPARLVPPPSPPQPIGTDDCHGWWRVCHAWQ